MKSIFFDTGNLGAEPILRDVPVDGGGSTNIINMRVRFDRPKLKQEGGYNDEGGFWADVSLIGKRAAKLSSLLHTGARVAVLGELTQEEYVKDGETRQAMKISASFIGPDPIAIDTIKFRTRNSESIESATT